MSVGVPWHDQQDQEKNDKLNGAHLGLSRSDLCAQSNTELVQKRKILSLGSDGRVSCLSSAEVRLANFFVIVCGSCAKKLTCEQYGEYRGDDSDDGRAQGLWALGVGRKTQRNDRRVAEIPAIDLRPAVLLRGIRIVGLPSRRLGTLSCVGFRPRGKTVARLFVPAGFY
jgi:hypothetical protein